eukprot:TRINITY_DN3237_c0_g1_i4.p1 TRINITY_DN3237_c0_g1~~TRINITY_DN3237_c0_g1_i4.p1  ORF type:complete len:1515 (-),score=159.08 TRINITY_DN3237_c0_g1_i4:389-4933(-)
MQFNDQNTSNNQQSDDSAQAQQKSASVGSTVQPRRLLHGTLNKGGKYGLGAQRMSSGNVPSRPPPSALNKQVLANTRKPPLPKPAMSPTIAKPEVANIEKMSAKVNSIQKKSDEPNPAEKNKEVTDVKDLGGSSKISQVEIREEQEEQQRAALQNSAQQQSSVQFPQVSQSNAQSKDTSQNSSLNTSLNEWLQSTENDADPVQLNKIQDSVEDNQPNLEEEGDNNNQIDDLTQAILKAYEQKAKQHSSQAQNRASSSVSQRKEQDLDFFENLAQERIEKTCDEQQNQHTTATMSPETGAQQQVQQSPQPRHQQQKEPSSAKQHLQTAALQAISADQNQKLSAILMNDMQHQEADQVDPAMEFFSSSPSTQATSTTVQDSMNINALRGVLKGGADENEGEIISSAPRPSSAPKIKQNLPSMHRSASAAYRDYWSQYYGCETQENQLSQHTEPTQNQSESVQNQQNLAQQQEQRQTYGGNQVQCSSQQQEQAAQDQGQWQAQYVHSSIQFQQQAQGQSSAQAFQLGLSPVVRSALQHSDSIPGESPIITTMRSNHLQYESTPEQFQKQQSYQNYQQQYVQNQHSSQQVIQSGVQEVYNARSSFYQNQNQGYDTTQHQQESQRTMDVTPQSWDDIGYVQPVVPATQQWDPNYQFQYIEPSQNQMDTAKYIQQSTVQFYQHMGNEQMPGLQTQESAHLSHSYFQPPVQQQQLTSSPPRSVQEALTCAIGRPPINLIAFGFGGKLIEVQPFPNSLLQTGSNVNIHNSFIEFVQTKTFPGPGRPQLESEYACMQKHIGPLLGSSVSKDRLLNFIQERIEQCEQEEISSFPLNELQMLWKLLGFLVKTGGKFHPSSAKNPSQNLNQELADILLSNVSQTETVRINQFGQPPLVVNPNVVYEVEQLLIRGQMQEAMECAAQGEMWGVALLLGRFCGEQAFKEIAWKMGQRVSSSGSPLNTICSLLAGQCQQLFQCELSNECAMWRENLAAMVMNRIPGDMEAMVKLGDKLQKDKRSTIPSHTCFIMARKQTDFCDQFTLPNEPNPQMVLVGCDHIANPRSLLSPLAIQRTEIYEWILHQAHQDTNILVAFLPYKLVYAYLLLDYGLVNEAARYCQVGMSMLGKLQNSRNSRIGGNVQLWWMQLQELQNRIQVYVDCFGVQISQKQAGLFGGLGKLIERGIDHIVGGSKIVQQTQTQQDGIQTKRPSSASVEYGTSHVVQGYQSPALQYQPKHNYSGSVQSDISRGISRSSSARSLQQQASTHQCNGTPHTNTTEGGWLSRFLGLGTSSTSKQKHYTATGQYEMPGNIQNKEQGASYFEQQQEKPRQVLAPPPVLSNTQQMHVNRDNIDARYVNTLRPSSPSGSQHSMQGSVSLPFRVPRPNRPNSAPSKVKHPIQSTVGIGTTQPHPPSAVPPPSQQYQGNQLQFHQPIYFQQPHYNAPIQRSGSGGGDNKQIQNITPVQKPFQSHSHSMNQYSKFTLPQPLLYQQQSFYQTQDKEQIEHQRGSFVSSVVDSAQEEMENLEL